MMPMIYYNKSRMEFTDVDMAKVSGQVLAFEHDLLLRMGRERMQPAMDLTIAT